MNFSEMTDGCDDFMFLRNYHKGGWDGFLLSLSYNISNRLLDVKPASITTCCPLFIQQKRMPATIESLFLELARNQNKNFRARERKCLWQNVFKINRIHSVSKIVQQLGARSQERQDVSKTVKLLLFYLGFSS